MLTRPAAPLALPSLADASVLCPMLRARNKPFTRPTFIISTAACSSGTVSSPPHHFVRNSTHAKCSASFTSVERTHAPGKTIHHSKRSRSSNADAFWNPHNVINSPTPWKMVKRLHKRARTSFTENFLRGLDGENHNLRKHEKCIIICVWRVFYPHTKK